MGSLLVGQTFRDLDLSSADGDARDFTAVVARQMSRGAADAAADVENRRVGRQLRHVEQEVDQLDLGGFFGLVAGLEVAVVDVLAPVDGGGG